MCALVCIGVHCCTYVCMCVHVCACVCMRVHVFACMSLYMHVCACVCICGRAERILIPLPKIGYEPQLNITNVYQGSTPLHFACSTGLADCVQLLVQNRANVNILDGKGRSCFQLASNCQGNGQILATWLEKNTENLDKSTGEGRTNENKCRGEFSQVSACHRAQPHQSQGLRQERQRQRQRL